MEHVAKYVTDLVGHTPLLELTRWQAVHGIKGRVLAKLNTSIPWAASRIEWPWP